MTAVAHTQGAFAAHLPGLHKACVGLSLCVFAAGAVFPLIPALRLALGNDHYSHIALVLAASIALIYVDRVRVFQKISPATNAAHVLGGLAAMELYLSWGAYADAIAAISFQTAAVVTFWIALFLYMFGKQAFGAAKFPLGLLALAIPLPDTLVQMLISVLQPASTAAAFWLMQLLRLPVIRHGCVLSLPQVTLEVGPECSGVRSTLVLVVSTLIIGFVIINSVWKRLVLLGLVLPIAILRNGLRIVTLAVAANYYDTDLMTSYLHGYGGILFFILNLLLMAGIAYVLERFVPPADRTRLP